MLLDFIHKKAIKVLFNLNKEYSKEVYIGRELLDLRHITMFNLLKIGYKWKHNQLPKKYKVY